MWLFFLRFGKVGWGASGTWGEGRGEGGVYKAFYPVLSREPTVGLAGVGVCVLLHTGRLQGSLRDRHSFCGQTSSVVVCWLFNVLATR